MNKSNIQNSKICQFLIEDKKFKYFNNIAHVSAFLLGVSLSQSVNFKFGIEFDGCWIPDFEEFITNYLNAELNNFNNEWEETISTSYSKWIYQNQKNDEDGLQKFYKILDLFILSVSEEG